MDIAAARALIEPTWEKSILPVLREYIAIPAKSPAFDRDWAAHGHLDRAVALAREWCETQALPGLSIEVVTLPGRTPVLWLEYPGTGSDETVLLYGHLDKQPEMQGWDADLGPWKPVVRDGRLYGRGGADDGYAVFASLLALRVLREQGLEHARCGVLIETCEESGSYDLPAYIDHLAPRIGRPGLVVCLDSGCGNYDQLWCTTSLRGLAAGVLKVEVLEEGVHSGDAGGVVPSSFRVARRLLSRLEDEQSGEIRLHELQAEIPAQRRRQAQAAAQVLGDAAFERFPFQGGAGPVARHGPELVLNRTWRASLEVVGAEGIPSLADAGNVLRPGTSLLISLRLPPTVDPALARDRIRETLEADPPYGARVSFKPGFVAPGWNAPALAPWLERSLETVSRDWFGPPAVMMGEGGTIPFMGMLGEKFPDAQFVITGVLGPGSNAHGPNEFLHLGTAQRLTGCVAQILALHDQQVRAARSA